MTEGTAQLADGGADSWITAIVAERRVLTRVVPAPAVPARPSPDQENAS